MLKRVLLSSLLIVSIMALNVSSVLAASPQLSVSINPTALMPLASGAQDVAVLDFSLMAGNEEDVAVTDLELYFVPVQGSPAEAIGQVRLVKKASGEQVVDPANVAGKIVPFSGKFEIEKGESLQLLAVIDAAPNAKAGDAFVPCVRSAKGLGSSSANFIKGIFATPRCGQAFVFAEADLNVALYSASAAAQNVPAGMNDVNVATFQFLAMNEDIRVDRLDFKYLPFEGQTQVKNAYLMDQDGVVVGTTSFVASDKTLSFDNLDWVIPKDDTKKLSVVVDLKAPGEGGVSDEAFILQLDAVEATAQTSGVEINKDVEVNSKTVTVI